MGEQEQDEGLPPGSGMKRGARARARQWEGPRRPSAGWALAQDGFSWPPADPKRNVSTEQVVWKQGLGQGWGGLNPAFCTRFVLHAPPAPPIPTVTHEELGPRHGHVRNRGATSLSGYPTTTASQPRHTLTLPCLPVCASAWSAVPCPRQLLRALCYHTVTHLGTSLSPPQLLCIQLHKP